MALAARRFLDSCVDSSVAVLVPDLEPESIALGLRELWSRSWDRESIKLHAKNFSVDEFGRRIEDTLRSAAQPESMPLLRSPPPDPSILTSEGTMQRSTNGAAVVRRFHPEVGAGGFTAIDGTVTFYERVNALLKTNDTLVDLGAGRGKIADDPVQFRRELQSVGKRVEKSIALDVDDAVLTNPLYDEKYVIGPGPRLCLSGAEASTSCSRTGRSSTLIIPAGSRPRLTEC